MDLVKAKERAMLRYRRLRRAVAWSRCLLESLAALALLSWFSDRLPAVLAHCACLLRRLPAVILHPLSAFVLGNAIVVILLAKSGKSHLADDPPPSRRAVADVAAAGTFDVYENLGYLFNPSFSAQPLSQLQWKEEEEEYVLFEDKAVCVEITTAACQPKKGRPESEREMGLRLRRVKSVDLSGAVTSKYTEQKLLFRSETDLVARQKVAAMWEEEEQAREEGGGGVVVVVDDSAEFRRKIEAFISKQLRFIEREEEELLFAEWNEAAGMGSVAITASKGAGTVLGSQQTSDPPRTVELLLLPHGEKHETLKKGMVTQTSTLARKTKTSSPPSTDHLQSGWTRLNSVLRL
ncbi:hypothetical protein Taro_052119 [Colocasia esculenta]|uniref:DUF4408 domain-containing protein n=1 Tax=Colocasia esculenta TaxID=4460 RepID=A0A843XHS7_COLES|nr:hypothetical protein [Colocasia esculenta]